MSRKCMALLGLASLTGVFAGCGDASDSTDVENGVSGPGGDLAADAVLLVDPEKIPPESEVLRYRYVRLASMIESERVKQGVPGIAVGVIENGKLAWAKGFGQKSIEEGAGQVSKTTMFRSPVLGIGLTRLLALNLAENGKLVINEPLSKYLPDLKVGYDPFSWFDQIALRHLFTWSSGLPRAAERSHWFTSPQVGLQQWSESQLFANMYVDFPPGRLVAGHSYAEPRLLALVAEEVTGMDFRKAVAERLLAPLEMSKTAYLSAEVDPRSVAVGITPVAMQDSALAAPVWGPYTNVQELAKFAQFFLRGNEAILSDSYRQLAMYQPIRIQNPESGCGEALVFHVDSPRCAENSVPVSIVSMDASVGGFKSAIYLAPAHQFGLVILSNGEDWNAMPIVKEAFRLSGIDSRLWTVPEPSTDFARYVGKYVTAAPWKNPLIEVIRIPVTHSFFQDATPLVLHWQVGETPLSCRLRPIARDAFKCEASVIPHLGKPPIFPTIIGEPSWDPDDRPIPLVPRTPVSGFEVRFVYDKHNQIEYLASSPFVGRRFGFAPLE